MDHAREHITASSGVDQSCFLSARCFAASFAGREVGLIRVAVDSQCHFHSYVHDRYCLQPECNKRSNMS